MSGYCINYCQGHANLNGKCSATNLPQTPSTSSILICDSYLETGCKWDKDPYGTAGDDSGNVSSNEVTTGILIDDPLWISIENDIIAERQRVGLSTGPILPSIRPATGTLITAAHYNSLVVALNGAASVPPSTSPGSQIFTATSTFTVPPNTNSVTVCLSGGGGAGGSQWYNTGGNWQSGAGGGGAGASTRTIDVQPDQRITVIIGKGGIGTNISGAQAGSGGTSSFGGSFSVSGGAGAINGNGLWPSQPGIGANGGGNGGNGSWDNVIIYSDGVPSNAGCGGVNPGGVRGHTVAFVWGGGGGGGGGLGSGGAGAGDAVHVNGLPGNIGGGGGGGATGGNVSMARGGHGGSGKAIVTWTETNAGQPGGNFSELPIGTIITAAQINALIAEINSSAGSCFCNCNFCACNCNNCTCNCNYSCTCNCNYL